MRIASNNRRKPKAVRYDKKALISEVARLVELPPDQATIIVEIVLNCMNQDGMRQGYDIAQLKMLRPFIHVPLIASGGAGQMQHFLDVFEQAQVDGALAASVFHKQEIEMSALKTFLKEYHIIMRM